MKFVNKNFDSVDDLLKLNEKFLINCLAFTSKKLFNDNQIYGKKGHLLEFRNTGEVT